MGVDVATDLRLDKVLEDVPKAEHELRRHYSLFKCPKPLNPTGNANPHYRFNFHGPNGLHGDLAIAELGVENKNR